jgi:Flp pilus assembly protein TadD
VPARVAWFAAAALILVAAVVLHAERVPTPFFADDYLFLEQVRYRSIADALTSPDPLGNFLRPIGRQLHFWVWARVGGESPRFFHVVNLGFFLIAIGLLIALARRLHGPRAAIVGGAFLALHYAADVPVGWASGAQDQLAVIGGLATILLYLNRRELLAALALLLALMSKETAVAAAPVAAWIGRGSGEPLPTTLRRAGPMLAALGLWIGIWLGTMGQRRAVGSTLALDPGAVPATIVHLLQTSLGLEVGLEEMTLRLTPWWWMAIALAGGAVWLIFSSDRGAGHPAAAQVEPRPWWSVGAIWALVAAVPIVAVAHIWSAYYYLFALCGVGLLLGAVAARGPRWGALMLVAICAVGSQYARERREFATRPGAWTWQSHVNDFYMERATSRLTHYLADLKRAHPTLPRRSTVFFSGLPSFVGLQTGDGPWLRWAYGDTSLRSHFLSEFTRARASRGPILVLGWESDSLIEPPADQALWAAAQSLLLEDRLDGAEDALRMLLEQHPQLEGFWYPLGWIQWARGDTISARASFARGEIDLRPGTPALLQKARAMLAAGDSEQAVRHLVENVQRHARDSELHGLLADLALRRDGMRHVAVVEAVAARALNEQEPDGWFRWGLVQMRSGHWSGAASSFERCLGLGEKDPERIAAARSMIGLLRRRLPGGDIMVRTLREGAQPAEPP